ncbi:MAG: carbonic anhydrase family protein [Spirochaetaceae bacterium]|jgi:carbonic anhydrase|nr:carbonic anhydrase family protein [Spirochaetaceae bacterium]
MDLATLTFSACAAVPPAQTTAQVASTGEKHWSYEGKTGPAYWHTLDPAYARAKDGKAQSPIDIDTAGLSVDSTVGKPVITYSKTLFVVKNNGHTIEATPVTTGNTLVLDGETYVLQQFHFHAPSEHLIDGEPFAMELHLVHKSAAGHLAVIGIMITEGAENETLKELFENLSSAAAREGAAQHETQINLAELFTGSGEAYRYDGSLTTPPCTEGVKWTIHTQPLTMARSQIDAFRAFYDGNNRPVQNREGRAIYLVQ